MDTPMKRKILFALSMGAITTATISFVVVALDRGFGDGFAIAWLRSWAAGYAIVIPIILLLGPRLEARIERLIR